MSVLLFIILFSITIKSLTINFNKHLFIIISSGIFFSLISILLIFLTQKLSNRIFLTLFLSLLFCGQLIYIFKFNIAPISDFEYMLNGAKEIVSGHFSSVYKDDYFFWYTTQLGYPLLESIILKFGNGSVYSLQIVNLLFIDGTILILYFIANKLFDNFSARLTTFFYGGYIGLFLFSSVLSNQHSGLFFIFSGLLLWLYNEKNSYRDMFLVGILISIGNIFYPIGILFIIALILYTLFLIKNSIPTKFILISFLILGYSIPSILVSILIIILGLSVHGITHFDNYWKFVLGLNKKSNGQYSLEDFKYLKESYLTRNEILHRQLEKKLIQERLENTQLFQLFWTKSLNMWGNPDDSYMYTQLPPFGRKNINNHWTIIIAVIQYCAFYILGLGVSIMNLGLILKNKIKNSNLLFFIILIGAFLIYLVIEQQIRYRYFFTPIFALIAGAIPYYFKKFFK